MSDAWDDLGGHKPDRPTTLHVQPEAEPGPPAPPDKAQAALTAARQHLGQPTRRRRSEDVQAKASRLLASGAVTVRSVTDDQVLAHVQGDTDTYQVQRTPDGWSCTCPCHGPRCSHIHAVRTITTRSPAT